jgi:uncharacterized protein
MGERTACVVWNHKIRPRRQINTLRVVKTAQATKEPPTARDLLCGWLRLYLPRVSPPADEAAILSIERPDKSLWTYYLIGCFAFPPAFPFLILPAWFRYSTMRYRFTDEGISMRWGILFRREIIINYARIQDIHIRSNIVERWLGLARVLVQTASGNAGAEMTIEGIRDFEGLRDFLYARMRGVKEHRSPGAAGGGGAPGAPGTPVNGTELASALREVAAELRQVRQLLAEGRGRGPHGDA